MTTLRLTLLGSPGLALDGKRVIIRRRKALALLAYLVETKRRHTREALAALFWPENDERRARANLRRAIVAINEALGKGWLLADPDRVGIDDSRDLCLDTDRFRTLAEDREGPGDSDATAALNEAVELYRGGFMAGFTLPDCPAFDEWCFFLREELQQTQASALETLTLNADKRRDYEEAITYARRWLELDPLHEPAHRLIMRLYAQTGRQSAALRQYDECLRILRDELDVEPEPETTETFQAIKANRFTPPRSPTVEGAADSPPSFAANSPNQPESSLPPQPTPFFGREDELAEIQRLLLNEPHCRLLTLAGPGGIGKTRLATEAGGAVASVFASGVVFVPLAGVADSESLVPTVAEALSFSFFGAEPQMQLINYLRGKEMLLILDNFEHLLGGVALLSEIVQTATQVKLLVTSRERLQLQEEWALELSGLSYPPDRFAPAQDDPTAATAFDAIQLFTQRARQARTDLDLTQEEHSIVRICQLVEGLPLALELAATWVRIMSCSEIVGEIEESLNFLSTPLQNVPARHRSMYAVFEQSWSHISEVERKHLAELSIFKGGFTRDAADQVVGAPLATLAALVDKSLLRHDQSGRYSLHELLRQFAAERRSVNSSTDHEEQTMDRHCAYYTEFLANREADLKSDRQLDALAEILADIDNVRSAWQWALEHNNAQAIGSSCESLWYVYDVQGWFKEGKEAFARAVAMLNDLPKDHQTGVASGAALACLGWFYSRLGRLQEAADIVRNSITTLDSISDAPPRTKAFALMWLGFFVSDLTTPVEGDSFVYESLRLYEEENDHWGKGIAMTLLGLAASRQGKLPDAEHLLGRAYKILGGVGDARYLQFVLIFLGSVFRYRGEYTRAKTCQLEGLEIARRLRDNYGTAWLLLDFARYYEWVGDEQQAESYFQAGLAACIEIDYPLGIAIGRYGLACVAREQGDYATAESLMHRSLQWLDSSGLNRWRAVAVHHLGELALAKAELERAKRAFVEALDLQTQYGDPVWSAKALAELGAVALRQANFNEALAHFQSAIELSSKADAIPVVLIGLTGVAACIILAEQEHAYATQLLTLVSEHPATQRRTKQWAEELLSDLESKVPTAAFLAAKARGSNRDVQATAAEVVNEYTGRPSHAQEGEQHLGMIAGGPLNGDL